MIDCNDPVEPPPDHDGFRYPDPPVDSEPEEPSLAARLACRLQAVQTLSALGEAWERSQLRMESQALEITQQCREAAAVGLTWKEIHEALSVQMEDPSALIPNATALYNKVRAL